MADSAGARHGGANNEGGSKGTLSCGPLLRYTYIDHATSIWNGTVLVVLNDSSSNPPVLHVRPAAEGRETPSPTCLYSDSDSVSSDNRNKWHTFWRFSLAVPLGEEDVKVVYTLRLPGGASTTNDNLKDSGSAESEQRNDAYRSGPGCGIEQREFAFWVPAKDETMRILFHSCNGFSLSVKKDAFAGPVLWKDVMRVHTENPLHVMIGGGDQVYSDAVRSEGPLKGWADHMSSHRRAQMQTDDKLKADLDEWYCNNYCTWYSTEPFCVAAASIPSLQIFDDHDIIDGFGSYEEKWMHADVFLEIGKVAWKYYMLFQHHTAPHGEQPEDPSWVLGTERGPYIKEYSRSICTTLGKRVVFYGLDCRVDRTLERVCYESTYDAMFTRLEKQVIKGQTNHLILLLGVPIAYPRLVWLEHLLSTHTIGLFRLLNKLFGWFGGVFNKFDGSAELLDDLNDHWCAHTHKKERNAFIQRLQKFATDKQVRVTILSGDVHLAAVGRFFSKAPLGIPQNKDPRYMVNVISSAITNAPPSNFVANLLDKRDRIHHLDRQTDENMMKIFEWNPNGKKNTVNRTTLPVRNYCIITEQTGLVQSQSQSQKQRPPAGSEGEDKAAAQGPGTGVVSKEGDDTDDMVPAYYQTGSIHDSSTAAPESGMIRKYALNVCINAEIDPKSAEGRTIGYGFSIPFLEL